MYIAQRHYIIPSSPEELALMKGTKGTKQIRIKFKDREYSVWTEENDDTGLVYDYLSQMDKRFYFEAIVLDKDIQPKRLADYIVRETVPEIVIDIRKQPAVGYNLDPVKVQLENNGIRFRWIPLLGTKGHLKDGLLEVNQLLKNYRRICFVGTSDRRLARICRMLKKSNRIEFQE